MKTKPSRPARRRPPNAAPRAVERVKMTSAARTLDGAQVALMNPEQCAKHIGVTTRTLRRMVHEGEVPVIRVRNRLRFHPLDVMRRITEPKKS